MIFFIVKFPEERFQLKVELSRNFGITFDVKLRI